jgi:hypothetical protein
VPWFFVFILWNVATPEISFDFFSFSSVLSKIRLAKHYLVPKYAPHIHAYSGSRYVMAGG